MTTKGFRTRWRKAKASYRNATGGRKNAERKKLVNLVMEELKREVESNPDIHGMQEQFSFSDLQVRLRVAA